MAERMIKHKVFFIWDWEAEEIWINRMANQGWNLIKRGDDPSYTPDDTIEGHLDTIPPYHTAYQAVWQTVSTKYTIIYWAENANDGYYSYWGTASADAISASTISPSEVASLGANSAIAKGLDEAEHFTYNAEKTAIENPATVTVAGDGSTVINVYYNRNRYRIDFIWDRSNSNTCQHAHTHTEACYQYFCITHVHNADCYVCNQIEHNHTPSCCSLAHTHSESCAKNCDHIHDITCYTNSTDIVPAIDQTGFNTVKATAGDSPQEGVIYRYATNNGSWWTTTYHNYIFINNTWYYLGTGNNASIKGLTWSGNNPDNNKAAASGTANTPATCSHVHESKCYSCGKTPHTHADDEVCNLAACPNGGSEHSHTAECYLCKKEENAHTEACCSIEEHAHTSCSASKCDHKHTITCYTKTTVPEATNQEGFTTVKNTAGTAPSEGVIYRYRQYNNYYHNYIYIGGVWYYLGTGGNNTVSGLAWSGSNPSSSTPVRKSSVTNEPSLCSHVHADKCYSCNMIAHSHNQSTCNIDNCTDNTHHVHTSDCFVCDYTHVHSASCNRSLVCILTEHTHGSGCTNSSSNNLVYSITAKYDADISSVWETDPILKHLNNGIVWQSSVTAQYYSFLEKMPGQNITMTYTEWSGDTYTWYYYLEVSPYETVASDIPIRTDNNVTYKWYHTTSVKGEGIRLTYEEDYFPITGYTQRDATVPSFSNGIAYLYYRINKSTLKYYNYSEAGPAPNNQVLYYNQALQAFNVTKEVMEQYYYPTGLEPNAYEFGGWYTTPDCFPGTEVDWNNGTMPATDLEVYAKWTPILRNVTFYSAYSDIALDEADKTDKVYHFMKAEGVPHGQTLGSTYYDIPE